MYGSTIEEAATNLLLEHFRAAEARGQGRSASVATQLVFEACRMGLHRQTGPLLQRVGAILGEDSVFDSLVTALEHLLALEISREPLEAQHLTGLTPLALAAYRRACFLIPNLAQIPEEIELTALYGLNALVQGAQSLGDAAELRELRAAACASLAATTQGNAAVRGGAVGLLFGDGVWDDGQVVATLRGHLQSSRDDGAEGADFLRGLLQTARSVLWNVSGVLEGITGVVAAWDERRFVQMLPLMRLALADLTPRETDLVARRVAASLGVDHPPVPLYSAVDAAQRQRGAALNQTLCETLAADGLEGFHD